MAELLAASVTLGMEDVASRCRAKLHKLSPETVLVVWDLAKRNGLDDIAEKAVKVIKITLEVRHRGQETKAGIPLFLLLKDLLLFEKNGSYRSSQILFFQ